MPVSSARPPHNLQLVIDFVNTLDVEQGIDALADATGLAAWLGARGLSDIGASPLRAGQRADAVELREAIRAVMLEHNGLDPDSEAAAALERAAARGQLSVCFDTDGAVRVAPRAPGFAGELARLLVPVAAAAADGTWERVKACPADDCGWAFYDHSRNRSGRWCDMAVCGNRSKVRAYRSKRSG